ncbi:MAG: N-acetyltransferase family protein [Gammaproteobacteria bacterium]
MKLTFRQGFTTALKDGELIDVRPVRPDDWQTIQNGMYALSEQSRYFRFFSPITKLSAAQLHYFTEVDQHDHVAWIALAHDINEHPGVAIARFIRLRERPHIAEFALTVIDNYQNRGLGTLLMTVLYLLAPSHGISILRAYVLPENRLMLGWLERLGAASCFENELLQMDLTVSNALLPPAIFALSQKVRQLLVENRAAQKINNG